MDCNTGAFLNECGVLKVTGKFYEYNYKPRPKKRKKPFNVRSFLNSLKKLRLDEQIRVVEILKRHYPERYREIIGLLQKQKIENEARKLKLKIEAELKRKAQERLRAQQRKAEAKRMHKRQERINREAASRKPRGASNREQKKQIMQETFNPIVEKEKSLRFISQAESKAGEMPSMKWDIDSLIAETKSTVNSLQKAEQYKDGPKVIKLSKRLGLLNRDLQRWINK